MVAMESAGDPVGDLSCTVDAGGGVFGSFSRAECATDDGDGMVTACTYAKAIRSQVTTGMQQ